MEEYYEVEYTWAGRANDKWSPEFVDPAMISIHTRESAQAYIDDKVQRARGIARHTSYRIVRVRCFREVI